MGRVHGCPKLTPVFTGVNTGSVYRPPSRVPYSYTGAQAEIIFLSEVIEPVVGYRVCV